MRIAHLTTVYPEFAALANRQVFHDLTLDEIRQQFLRDGFLGHLPEHLRDLGHDSIEIGGMLEPLQKAWAREHGVQCGESTWFSDVAMRQLAAFEPEIVYFDNLHVYDRVFRDRVRRTVPRARLAGWCNVPPFELRQFSDVPLVLTSVPGLAERYRSIGVQSEVVRLGFEERGFQPRGAIEPRDLTFTFAGTIGSPIARHSGRFHLIARLMETTPLEVWGDLAVGSWKGRLAEIVGLWANRLLESVALEARAKVPIVNRGSARWLQHRFRSRFHPAVFGAPYFQVLGRSKLVLNSHMDISSDSASNYRLFEATGMGACLLTDWTPDLDTIFEPDSEVVAYRCADECIEQATWLLDHDRERTAIADAGQRRTLRDHTMAHHAARLVDIFERYLA